MIGVQSAESTEGMFLLIAILTKVEMMEYLSASSYSTQDWSIKSELLCIGAMFLRPNKTSCGVAQTFEECARAHQ